MSTQEAQAILEALKRLVDSYPRKDLTLQQVFAIDNAKSILEIFNDEK
jgi:hypothetical protein